MSKAPKPYPDQFKREAVELVRISGRPIRQIADEIGVADQTLRNWIAKDEAARGGPDARLSDDEREELKLLRKENKRLKMEREILKKAAVNSMRERNSVRVDQALKGPECRGSVGSTRWRSGGSFGIDGRPGSRQARSRELWIVRRARSMASLSSMVVLPRG
jgi:transposase